MDQMGAIARHYETDCATLRKQRRTNDSRLRHYIQFCESMDVDPSLRSVSHNDQTIVAILYLHHIAGGQTLLGLRCRYDTIKNYMAAMIDFVQLPSNAGRDVTLTPDPTKAMHLWKEHPLITSIYAEIKR